MSRPDLLNLKPKARKKLMRRPPKDSTEPYTQAVIRWVLKTQSQKEPQTAVPLGGKSPGSVSNE